MCEIERVKKTVSTLFIHNFILIFINNFSQMRLLLFYILLQFILYHSSMWLWYWEKRVECRKLQLFCDDDDDDVTWDAFQENNISCCLCFYSKKTLLFKMQAIINITTRRCEDEEIHKNGFSFSSFHYHHVMLCFIFSVVDKKKKL